MIQASDITAPGYYFVEEEMWKSASLAGETDHMTLVSFLRRIDRKSVKGSVAIEGLGGAMIFIEPSRLARLMRSILQGKGNYVLTRRISAVFVVNQIRKNYYHYVFQEKEKLRLEDIFGRGVESLKSTEDLLFFAHPTSI